MVVLKVKEKEYYLRLSTKRCVETEQRLGKNPLNVFMETSEANVPNISDLMVILHESLLDMNHGLKMDDVYSLYDDWSQDGGNLMKLLEVLVEVFQDAGFIPKETEETKN